MDDKTIPYIAYEATQARNERTVKRLIIAVIVAIALLFASNAAWLYAWTQYDYSSTETESYVNLNSRSGPANYIGNNGDIHNGQSNSN